jgi:hypothetical protein
MPKKGPFVEDKLADWTKRLSSLTAEDVTWYSHQLDSPKMLLKCVGFTNVPLVGIQGCINYNSILAIRQLGYPFEGEPEKASLVEFVLKSESDDPELWNKIKDAWKQVYKTRIGKKNCLARNAYCCPCGTSGARANCNPGRDRCHESSDSSLKSKK